MSKRNYCEKLTPAILDSLPPMRIIIFDKGLECLSQWLVGKQVHSRLCEKKSSKGKYSFYYISKFITIETSLENLRIKK